MSPGSTLPALPERIASLGLVLEVRRCEDALPPVPETAWLEAELLDQTTRVAVLPVAPGCHRLALERFGDYTVDLAAGRVDVHRAPEQGLGLGEVLDGPILLHALGARGIHVLHASAFRLPDGQVWAFTADSGTGKSSLAERAQARGWVRVADDLLALCVDEEAIVARPGLRQPKLSTAEQPGASLPDRLPLTGLCALRRVDGPARLQPLDTDDAKRLVVTATVATRMYGLDALTTHLRFAARFVGSVREGRLRVAELGLPDRPDDIPGALDEALDLVMRATAVP